MTLGIDLVKLLRSGLKYVAMDMHAQLIDELIPIGTLIGYHVKSKII